MIVNVLYAVYELGFGGVEQVLYNYISMLQQVCIEY